MKRIGFALLLTSACTTAAPVHGLFSLEKDAGVQCKKHCGDLDMRMSAVVIIANMTGCVCEPLESKTGQSGGASANTSGAVASLMAAQEQQRKQQEEQQRQTTQRQGQQTHH